jgi:hypothetical protein
MSVFEKEQIGHRKDSSYEQENRTKSIWDVPYWFIWRRTLRVVWSVVSDISKTLLIQFPAKQGRALLCGHYALWWWKLDIHRTVNSAYTDL